MRPVGLIELLLGTSIFWIVVLVIVALYLLRTTVKVLRGYERAGIFRLGRAAKGGRDRRARTCQRAREPQAREKPAGAGRVLAADPVSIQLRYLQTLTE